jgi:hypothetical protein
MNFIVRKIKRHIYRNNTQYITILTALILISLTIVFGINRANLLEKISKNQSDILNQQLHILNLQSTIDEIQKYSSNELAQSKKTDEELREAIRLRSEENEKLKKEQDDIKGMTTRSILGLQKTIVDSKAPDLSSIIEIWKPRIVTIECDFKYANKNQIYKTQTGSGTITNLNGNTITIITSKHVVVDDNKYIPNECEIEIRDTKYRISNQSIKIEDDIDSATITVENIYNSNIPTTPFSVCKTSPNIGDGVVIIGFPAIGSKTDITATEGIIAGNDGDYYITSAKVESGNSGGAAIYSKHNCYLGIPTFAKKGVIESLARILKQEIIFR